MSQAFLAAPGAALRLAERALAWTRDGVRLRCLIPGALGAAIDAGTGRLAGCVSRSLLAQDPALVARTLLEAPVAALLTFRLAALHAAAIVGTRGAAVVRGPAGAGKSTLAAACHAAGLRVLADESLLVDPGEPDVVHATVRDLTLRGRVGGTGDVSPRRARGSRGGRRMRAIRHRMRRRLSTYTSPP